MAENCTHDCSSCSADCSSRDLRVPANAMSSIKRVIAVVSGKGGVGKSTVTASLAAAMAKKAAGWPFGRLTLPALHPDRVWHPPAGHRIRRWH